jgi:hypothetical protein
LQRRTVAERTVFRFNQIKGDKVAMPDMDGNNDAASASENPLNDAIKLVERALVILDSNGLTLSAARLDHALVTLRAEAAKLG